MVKKYPEIIARFSDGYGKNEYHEHKPINDSIEIKTFISEKGGHKYVEAYKCTYKYDQLLIKYNPKNTVYGGWGSYDSHERKNRISWKIYQSDGFVLNYDQISLEDIEFYLQNRADRENYLAMMPLLRTLKKWRLAEIENEKHFVTMVIQQVTAATLKKPIVDLENKVWGAVEWWKFKNKFKRPIDKDDAKALRMIQGKIIADNKND